MRDRHTQRKRERRTRAHGQREREKEIDSMILISDGNKIGLSGRKKNPFCDCFGLKKCLKLIKEQRYCSLSAHLFLSFMGYLVQ